MVVELFGGMGNQMFQYALFLKLKHLGVDVKYDISEYDREDKLRKYSLDVFNINTENDSTIEGETLLFKIANRLQKNGLIFDEMVGDRVGYYRPEVFQQSKYTRIRGYWQNEMYFSDISDLVRCTYSFDEKKINNKNIELGKQMSSVDSVSVHIRRGDYLDEVNQKIYGGICDEKYYKKAISQIKSLVPGAVLYVFSDDLEWVKENIIKDDMTLIDWNKEDDSWQDMYLMSRCKHHIIANSTFSWWGAWLGNNDDKIVITPNKWFANRESTEIICDDWIRIR